jgi:phytoene desaturase
VAEVVVVGAGLGGLSSAVALAAAGHRVRVLEGADRPGGKAGVATVDGLEVDTGPSLLTLPVVFDELFRRAGTRLADEVELRPLEPAFRYVWPDGVTLDFSHEVDRTLAEVRSTLGPRAESELADFLRYARGVWETAAPVFVRGAAPTFTRLASVRNLRALAKVDPLRTMLGAIEARIRTRHLRDVLMRHATYNGSDPRRAPATLCCIAHVDLELGGLGVRGGIHELVRALVRVAERLGARFEYGRWVERVDGRGVSLGGRRIAADAVVVNADVAHLRGTLHPRSRAPQVAGPPSTSAWNAILRASRGTRRVAHTVLFPRYYEREFADLFDHGRPPREPTVYLCAQSVAHERPGWDDADPVFVMVNAPAEPVRASTPARTWEDVEATVESRLRGAGLMADGDRFVWRRTPADLAERFPGSRGALYGAASNSPLAAFRRPANRVRGVPGLYLASGSAHPGGGMPLCVLSGRAAADAVIEDLGAPRAVDAAE